MMGNFVQKIKNLMPSKRKLIQLYTALLFNANFKGFAQGSIYKGNTKILCAPGINCYSCPGAIAACPLGTLQGAISSDKSTMYYVGGILLLYSMLFGRMICGWFCPFGFIQELVYKIKTPKMKKNKATRVLSYLKYVILVFFVFCVPIIYAFRDTPLPAFCKYICPAGTIEGGLTLLSNEVNASYFSMLGPIFTWKFLLMVSIMVGCVFVFRLFCRFLCPLGALYGLFNKISVFGVTVDAPKCTNCNLCVNHCKMDVTKVGDQECISCGECINVCPTKAIQWKGTGLFRKGTNAASGTSEENKKARNITRGITTAVMIAFLIGVVAYYWQSTPDFVPPAEGNQVGDSCPDYDLHRVDGSGILEETIDPTKTGKITIINFWGTWCTPCVNELPYFDQIAANYADNVTVIAVHTNMINNTAPNYIKEHYPDSKILFATDDADPDTKTEVYYTTLGGRDTYPYTVVLDENGVIVKIFFEAVHYEDLEKVVEFELNN